MPYAAIFKNTGWLLAEKTLRIGGAIILNIWIARYLAPSGLGILATAQSVAMILSPLASFALDGILVRDIARTPGTSRRFMGNALTIRLTGSLVSWAIGITALGFLSPNLSWADWGAAALIMGLGLANSGEIIESWFLANLRSSEIVRLRLFAFAIASALRIAALACDLGIVWIAASLLLEPALTSIFLLIRALPKIPPDETAQDYPGIRYMLKEAYPLMFSFFAYQIYTRIDQSIVMSNLGPTDAGLYAASTRIIEIPMILSAAFATSLFPFLARTTQSCSESTTLDRYRPWIALASLFAWGYSAILFFFGEQLAALLLGPQYAPAGHIAFLRSFGLIFFLNGFLNSSYITTQGHQRILPYTTVIGATLCIPLNLWIVRTIGLTGVACVWSLSQFIVLMALNFFWPVMRPFGRMQISSLFGRGLSMLIRRPATI